MKENALVQLFQTVSGTLNLIDCWVCSLPLDSYDLHLIVIPLNLIEKSIQNSRSWLQLLYFPCKTVVNSSWYLPHFNSIAFRQILWADYWWPGQMGQFVQTALIYSFQNQGLESIILTELGTCHLAGRPCWDTGWQCLLDWCRVYLEGPNNVNNPLFLGELSLPSG